MSDRVDLQEMGKQARSARRALATALTTTKNEILEAMRKHTTIEDALSACRIIKKQGIIFGHLF